MIKKPEAFILGSSAKGLTIEQLMNYGVGGYDLDSDGRPTLSIKDVYNKEAWTRRCVSVIGSTLSSMPWSVYQGTDTDEPVWTFDMSAPDEYAWMDLDGFLMRSSMSLKVAGAAYALKRVEGGKKTGLQWFSPDTVSPKMTAEGITAYKRMTNGREWEIPAELMVAVFGPDVYAEQGPGIADGATAKVNSQILHDLANYTTEQLGSGLVSKTFWMVDKDARIPNEETAKTGLKNYLRKLGLYKGTPPELVQGIEPKTFGANLSDLASDILTDKAREAVATAFGVPHSLVMSNAANFATAEADQINFYVNTIIPQGRVIASALNGQLFNELGLRFVFEPKKLEVMQALEMKKAEAVKELVGVPPLTINEGREMLDKEPFTESELAAHIAQHKTPVTNFSTSAAPAQDEGKALDIRNWKRKAKRNRKAAFNPDHLSAHETSVIMERIAEGRDLEDVFKAPFTGF